MSPQPADPFNVKVLAPTGVARQLGRRAFLAGLAGAAAVPALAACGGSGSASSSSSSAGGAATSSGAAATSSSAAASSGSASGGGSIEGALSVYTWGAYDDPKTFKNYTTQLGPKVTISSYDSNQEMIAKLVAAKGTSGYDIVVPTGPYVPQMIANKLLLQLDHSKIPNLAKVEKQYLAQTWDPTNKYSVCKDWGTTGFVYDTTKIKRNLTSWSDFLDAAQKEASGSTSMLDVPEDVTGAYFWSKGIDWTTTKSSDLDAAEKFLVHTLAKHIKKFDSYPGSGGAMPQGSYTLMQAWNGDARQGIEAAKNPTRYKWVLPTPATELWMDNWCIASGAKHVNAAHAFINFVLDPANSAREIKFMGYNAGVAGTEKVVAASGAKLLNMVYFTNAEVARMKTGVVNSATQRNLDILNNVKAAAAH
jgi:spermidine/putrescine transport system substrate-binding protein